MIQKLLIANRGEIVCRIGRTCRRLGIPVATVHSVADRNSLHVRAIGESIEIGPAPAAQSYLNIDAILAAAKRVGADAIHPGIGFLSENPQLAQAALDAGLLFIGPDPDHLARFGDKWSAKHQARLANVPVIGGSEGSSSNAAQIEGVIREQLRLPIVLKATAGGGGRGVRVVRELEGLSRAIESAMREAQSSFGRGDLIVEEFIESAHHVEVQVAGDGHGNAIHLFERECSLQRRFQKILEEAPAAHLEPGLRARILDDAVRLAKSVRYKNVGTIEFLVSGDRYHFLECNPRLQVEHTVTEEITGLDLVELQLAIAMNGALPYSQDEIRARGHAVQLRVYAEDATAGFIPSTGRLTAVEFPPQARVETAVEVGSDISSYYDPMIAKLIFYGKTREQALELSLSGLRDTLITGVETNCEFLSRLLTDPVVRAGTADNRFIDDNLPLLIQKSAADPEHVAIAAAILWLAQKAHANLGLWAGGVGLTGWSYADGKDGPHGPPAFTLQEQDGTPWPISFGHASTERLVVHVGTTPIALAASRLDQVRYRVVIGDTIWIVTSSMAGPAIHIQGPFGVHTFTALPYLAAEVGGDAHGNKLFAPMMGTILSVNVKAGDRVKRSEVLIVEESMKMELTIHSPCDATIVTVRCKIGDIVERNQCLIELDATKDGDSRSGERR